MQHKQSWFKILGFSIHHEIPRKYITVKFQNVFNPATKQNISFSTSKTVFCSIMTGNTNNQA